MTRVQLAMWVSNLWREKSSSLTIRWLQRKIWLWRTSMWLLIRDSWKWLDAGKGLLDKDKPEGGEISKEMMIRELIRFRMLGTIQHWLGLSFHRWAIWCRKLCPNKMKTKRTRRSIRRRFWIWSKMINYQSTTAKESIQVKSSCFCRVSQILSRRLWGKEKRWRSDLSAWLHILTRSKCQELPCMTLNWITEASCSCSRQRISSSHSKGQVWSILTCKQEIDSLKRSRWVYFYCCCTCVCTWLWPW